MLTQLVLPRAIVRAASYPTFSLSLLIAASSNMLKVFGNGTDGVSWTSEPRTRGTFSILSSCVVTILLCVSTALHLNIPDYRDEGRRWISRRSLWSKVTWLIFALVAPELVAYTAFYQRSEAVKLVCYLRPHFIQVETNYAESGNL